MQDLTERRRTEQQIRYLAYHDGLTGLGNRLMFSERIELAIAQARRHGTRLGVLFLDLDDFKRINDTLGHDVGDELLREVADRLVRGAREAELASRELDQGFEPAVARLGGDEFTVLVTELRDPSDLALVAEHLLHGLQRPCRLDGNELVINASIGIATWPSDGERVEALLSSADSAMYHAKAGGRNTYQFYDASMNEVALRRLAVEVRLRARPGARRSHAPLPAEARARERAHRGLRGARALARWRAGRGVSGGLRADRRADGPDRSARALGARGGLPAGRPAPRPSWRALGRASPSTSRRASSDRRFARDIASTLERCGVKPAAAPARDHGERDHARRAGRGRRARGPARPRALDRARRLRHRLLVARPTCAGCPWTR